MLRVLVVIEDDLLVHLNPFAPSWSRPEHLLPPNARHQRVDLGERRCRCRTTPASWPARRTGASPAARSGDRPAPRCRRSSSTWATSCGWTPSTTNAIVAPRSTGSDAADDPHPVDLPQLGQRVGDQLVSRGRDRVHPDARQVVDGRAEPDGLRQSSACRPRSAAGRARRSWRPCVTVSIIDPPLEERRHARPATRGGP